MTQRCHGTKGLPCQRQLNNGLYKQYVMAVLGNKSDISCMHEKRTETHVQGHLNIVR